jgi:hypothetical protein
MQSSAAVVLRALVMLVCLVAIPLAALFGSALPKYVRTVMDGRWPGSLSADGGTPGEVPQFQAVVPGVTPLAQAAQMMPDWPANGLREGPKSAHAVHEPSLPTVTAAVYEAPLGPAMGRAGGGQSVEGVASSYQSAPGPAASDLAPARNPSAWTPPAQPPHQAPPAAQPAPLRGPALPPGNPAAQAPGAPDQFSLIQDRLRKLGATYYLLESWGSQQDLYRFYCKMAIGGNPNYTCHFEATHSEPLRAMALVLQQVEAWRASRE